MLRESTAVLRRTFRLSVLVLSLAPAWLDAAAAHKNAKFRRYTVSHGLSQSWVFCIVQDRHGFMWFGTQEGLNRFDGYRFQVFSHNPKDPTSIAHHSVRALFEDRRGLLWVGTEGGGVSLFDPAQETFTHLRHNPGDPKSLSSDLVRAIYEDRAGRLWVGTDGGGLNLWDRETRSFLRFGSQAGSSGLGSALVRSLAEDRDGALWVGTDGSGLYRIDPRTGSTTQFLPDAHDPGGLSDNRVRSVFVDSRGTLWVGTYENGLSRRHGATGRFTHYRHRPDDPRSLSSNVVRSIAQDRNGVLWIGTDRGLNEWLPESDGFAVYRNDVADPWSLNHDRVVSIYEDRGGILWVGTYGGLHSWNTATLNFRLYRPSKVGSGQLSNSFVTSFAEAPDGGLWIGTLGGGLNHLRRATGEFRHFRHDPGDETSLSDDRVMALHSDRSGTLWAGTLQGGLNRLDGSGQGFRRFRHQPQDPTSLVYNGVTTILEDSRGGFWVGTYGGGLDRLDRNSGRFTHHRHHPEDAGSVSNDRIIALFEDSLGTLLVGTDGGGLSRLDLEGGTFTSYRHDPTHLASLSSNQVSTLAEDGRGDLWIGTRGGGLNRWSWALRSAGQARFEQFTKPDGLLSDVVHGILVDDQGDVWVSDNLGLTRFDPENHRFRYYAEDHGLQSNEFNHGAALLAQDGDLLFGGVNGFNAFSPHSIQDNAHVPPVVLTRFLKFNRPFAFDQPLAALEEIELDHNDAVISFEFAALDFASPENNRYRYKLEGVNRDWIGPDSMRRATYTNLRHGEYTFRVKAANNDGVWNEEGIAVELRVLPAPWQTWWAYSLYALLLATAVMGTSRMLARERRRAAALALANSRLENVNQDLAGEIAERTAKEEALRVEKEKAQTYLDTAEVIMLVIESDGRVSLINQKGCRVLECSEGEIIGQSWIDTFLLPEDRESFRAQIHGQVRDSFESRVVTRQGQRRTIVWHATSLPSEDGSFRTLCSGTDVTEARRLVAAKESAESANRAKSRFLATMSHEIRTPMAGVLGMIELLLKEDLHSRQRRYAKTALRSARALLILLNDILDFSKIEAGKLEFENADFDLRDLIEDVAELFAELAQRKAIRLGCVVPPSMPTLVRGDPTRLRQILSNLVGNAIKFTDKGQVTLRIAYFEVVDGVLRCRFEVEDTGVGLAAEVQEEVFEAFRQADESNTRKFGGTGLGLAISRQLVEMMHGSMGVESSQGEGSLFWFKVDLVLQPPADTALPAHSATGGNGAAGLGPEPLRLDAHILLAEDEPVVQEVARQMVERIGGTVEVASSGRDAIEAMSKNRFDLVLMDCQMPEVDGYAATRAIREMETSGALATAGKAAEDSPDGAPRRIPIIAMTANAMAGDREECLAAGMDDHLTKPFSASDMFCILRTWLPEKMTGGEGGSPPRRDAP